MNKLLHILAGLLVSHAALAASIEGHTIPDQLPAAGGQLVLNGAGLRDKFMIDLYVGGLYLPQKSSDANAIIAADEPMAMRLLIVSSRITSENLSEAVAEGFEHALGDRQAAMQPRIDEFLNTFKQEAINEGDVFEMLYQPGTGTLISKNGKQINTIKGLDFKSALFAIWLGKEPAQDSLKQGMLGQ